MFDWFSGDKRRAKEAMEKAERDARLRAELAVKARQFDEENGQQLREATAMTRSEISQPDPEVLVTPGGEKLAAASSSTIHDYSARTSFNF